MRMRLLLSVLDGRGKALLPIYPCRLSGIENKGISLCAWMRTARLVLLLPHRISEADG
jgi:hypothetical protein